MDWKPDYSKTPQRVVCAACKHQNGTVVIGVRHFDDIMRQTLKLRLNRYPDEIWDNCEQGFTDQFGEWLSREEAWLVACKQNQIFRLVGNQEKQDLGKSGIKLYSENLY